ncbi:alpha/beta hydrolase, partial [Actinosynnema sp. NPDC023926]
MALSLVGVTPANAEVEYRRGPAPTNSSIEASRGPFATATTTVSSLSVSGFGGGTIYYPTSTAEGTFGAIAVSPGYTASQSTMSWLGPRIASQGFVVFTIDTNSRYDQPDSRASQLLAALDYLTGSSSVRSRIDASRLGVMATPNAAGVARARRGRSRRSWRPTAPTRRGSGW